MIRSPGSAMCGSKCSKATSRCSGVSRENIGKNTVLATMQTLITLSSGISLTAGTDNPTLTTGADNVLAAGNLGDGPHQGAANLD